MTTSHPSTSSSHHFGPSHLRQPDHPDHLDLQIQSIDQLLHHSQQEAQQQQQPSATTNPWISDNPSV
ncbi:hypothetical protein PGT21_000148 [Puccinia graminis f. sp. tritici]|uniref:Uncharacterized protein n=1 Tax=Puccinia graminis f. sp. tritici TaxID=56615 RepID=A0A5B0N9Y8_PUCGR|nr:hypothetical protein PGT21_000148 [Puccinia graminis f. sp. tritici]